MYSKEHIERLNSQLVTIQEQLQRDVDEYLKNKDNSLEDRWEVWTKYSQKNDEYDYHQFPEDRFPKLTDEYMDDASRHSRVDYEEFISAQLTLLAREKFGVKWYYEITDEQESEIENHPKIHELMEYIMEKNLGTVEIDW